MIQVNRIYLIFNRLVTKKFFVDTSDMNQQKNDTEVLSLSFKCSFIFLSKELSAQTN